MPAAKKLRLRRLTTSWMHREGSFRGTVNPRSTVYVTAWLFIFDTARLANCKTATLLSKQKPIIKREEIPARPSYIDDSIRNVVQYVKRIVFTSQWRCCSFLYESRNCEVVTKKWYRRISIELKKFGKQKMLFPAFLFKKSYSLAIWRIFLW